MRQTYRKGDANMQYLSADNDGMWLVDISKVWEYEPMEHWMDGWEYKCEGAIFSVLRIYLSIYQLI